jgi:CubicO group peptidase (beta-lactamase class C family)
MRRRDGARALVLATLLGLPAAHAEPAGAPPAVEAVVRAAMQATGTPGVAIALVRGGELLATQGFGFANVEHDVPVTEHTVFQSGSLGKQLTAALVMLLVEDGTLGLDQRIAPYFPGAPRSWRDITVRHLLTHTSGIPDFGPSDIDLTRDYSDDELAARAYALELAFAPGSGWTYSNTGYLLLGLLIERVSGRFYGDLLQARVFGPLGMRTTRIISESDIVKHRAAGYRSVAGVLKNQEWVAPTINTTADGSLYLTVLDLVAWDRAVRNRSLLAPASWEQTFAPVRLADGSTRPYGFGWELEPHAGQPTVSHTGSWQGFTSAIARFLARDLTVIVLANHADLDAGELARTIAGALDPALAAPTSAGRQ